MLTPDTITDASFTWTDADESRWQALMDAADAMRPTPYTDFRDDPDGSQWLADAERLAAHERAAQRDAEIVRRYPDEKGSGKPSDAAGYPLLTDEQIASIPF